MGFVFVGFFFVWNFSVYYNFFEINDFYTKGYLTSESTVIADKEKYIVMQSDKTVLNCKITKQYICEKEG